MGSLDLVGQYFHHAESHGDSKDGQKSLEKHAERFLQDITQSYSESRVVSSITCSIYDTAWISMIMKQSETGAEEWLFPDSFDWLLSQQRDDGAWPTYAAPIDAILNTMASLLAVCKHIRRDRSGTPSSSSDQILLLEEKMKSATVSLQSMLDAWEVVDTGHVGYEMIVPTHLDLLESEGISFNFRQRDLLYQARDAKLARFRPELLYRRPLSVLHSLEAMIGVIDFDRVKHHLVNGSMMSSPASTSAYLINASSWDDEAEAYLRRVVKYGLGQGTGCVPSAFPSTLFEISWVITLLLSAGYSKRLFENETVHELQLTLIRAFKQNQGIIGFAPGLEADADDTAMGITALNLLSIPTDATRLIDQFEGSHHFKTYEAERNASFTTNCNVLTALIHSPRGFNLYAIQVSKTVSFLLTSWYESNGRLSDKWNLSPFYSVMNMCRSLAFFLTAQLKYQHTCHHLVTEVQLVLLQALSYLLRTQNGNGSWGAAEGQEETAYATLALKAIFELPLIRSLQSELRPILEKSFEFLRERLETEQAPEYLWIEKVSYASMTLHQAYTLAALGPEAWSTSASEETPVVSKGESQASTELLKLCSHMSIFKTLRLTQLKISLIEAEILSKLMRNGIPSIFPRENMRKETYLKFIPFTWTAGNHLENNRLDKQELVEMMVISAIIYQADEYMERAVASLDEEQAGELLVRLDFMFTGETQMLSGAPHYVDLRNSRDSDEKPKKRARSTVSESGIAPIVATLREFVTFVTQKSFVQSATHVFRRQLWFDLKAFLRGHILQVQANGDLQRRNHSRIDQRFGSFFNWIRTTSSDHTGGPFAFSYFCCLITEKRGSQARSGLPEALYAAQDVSRHLSAMCRMYNDWASVVRDEEECNVNSVHFEEFRTIRVAAARRQLDDGHKVSRPDQEDDFRHPMKVREALFDVAQYERRCLEHALKELKQMASAELYSAIQAFCHTTDVYGQMYMVKDMTPKLASSEVQKPRAR